MTTPYHPYHQPPTYDCDVITSNHAHTITYTNILLLLSCCFSKKILCMCCCCCCCCSVVAVVVVIIMDPSHHQVITMDPSHRHGSKSPSRHHHHGSKSSSWIQVTINSPAYHIHTIHIKNIQEQKKCFKIFTSVGILRQFVILSISISDIGAEINCCR